MDLPLWDVLLGVLACVRHRPRERLEAGVLELCSVADEGLVCYSVRSGWDLWLEALGLSAGDEVIVSAVTHPDMVRIIRGHGLRAVPVDFDPKTLAPRPLTLEAAITPRTRVVLVAHLFGARMDLDPVARFAREHGLRLAEDCAQAFQGPETVADMVADVSMFSFGTLKTSTALGGAVLRVRDVEVLRRMREVQASYPVQRRGSYATKLLRALAIVVVSRPLPYGLLARACDHCGSDLDALVNGAVRAFPRQEQEQAFLRRLRHRPSAPLLAMLFRRLSTFDRERLSRRASAGERFARRLWEDTAPSWSGFVTEDALALSCGCRGSGGPDLGPPGARSGREPGHQQHRRRRSASRTFFARRSVADDVWCRLSAGVSGDPPAGVRRDGGSRQRPCRPKRTRGMGRNHRWHHLPQDHSRPARLRCTRDPSQDLRCSRIRGHGNGSLSPKRGA